MMQVEVEKAGGNLGLPFNKKLAITSEDGFVSIKESNCIYDAEIWHDQARAYA
jgi:hypothetical protein